MARIALVRIDRPVLRAAGELPPARLRSRDAIQIATALSLGEPFEVVLTYDERMVKAGEAAGLVVASPA